MRKKAIADAFAGLLGEAVKALKRCYGRNLVSVVVFGSVGRGDARADSDVDLLIVADDLPRGRMARVGSLEPAKRALEQRLQSLQRQGICTRLAPVFKTRAEVRAGSLLFLDMIEDGRVLFDRRGFWRGFIRSFQRRLDRLGARKIMVGDRWYWDLKPDYRPGEVFEI